MFLKSFSKPLIIFTGLTLLLLFVLSCFMGAGVSILGAFVALSVVFVSFAVFYWLGFREKRSDAKAMLKNFYFAEFAKIFIFVVGVVLSMFLLRDKTSFIFSLIFFYIMFVVAGFHVQWRNIDGC